MVDTFEVIAGALEIVSLWIDGATEDESRKDCSFHPQALTIIAIGSVGADCQEERRKAISEDEDCP
jgi:hypothetical protein